MRLGPCCFSGALDRGTPQGSLQRLGGVDTYVARPSAPTDKAVVIASYLFGLNVAVSSLYSWLAGCCPDRC